MDLLARLDAILKNSPQMAGHLDPLDLLHLSRTCRRIRDLLMSKRSAPIWRAARDNLSLPSCPTDLNEPQYAKLLFDTDCHVCYSTYFVASVLVTSA